MAANKDSRFCTNCGELIKTVWQFCSQCGTAVPPEAKIHLAEEVKESEPKVVATSSTEEVNSQIPEEKHQDPVPPMSEKTLLVIMLVMFLIVGLVGVNAYLNRDCPTRPSIKASNEKCLSEEELAAKKEAKKQREIEEAKRAEENAKREERNDFLDRLGSYRDNGCKPIIEDERGKYGLGLIFMDSDGSWEDFERLRFGERKPEDRLYSGDWGNEADKVLMMSAAYEARIAEIYEDIQIFDSTKELGKYRADMNKYLALASQVSRRLCKVTSPTEGDLKYASDAREKLLNDWIKFDQWATLVAGEAEYFSAELEESSKPQCTEIATSNPDYNIVRCTNLP